MIAFIFFYCTGSFNAVMLVIVNHNQQFNLVDNYSFC